MSDQSTPTAAAVARRREAELKSLYLIAQAVNFSMPLDDVLELIYTQLERVIPAPNFYMALLDPATRTFSFTFYVEDGQRRYPELVWSVDEGLTGVIYRSGVSIRADDYLEACRARDITPGRQRTGAWMGVPLMTQDQLLGVMVLSHTDPERTFSEEDESFFTTVASYTAAGIERRRLHDRLETRAHQLKTLNEIGKLLASSLDLDEVLALVVQNAAELLDAEAGSLLLVDEDSGDLVFRISNGPAGDQLVGLRVPAGKGIAGEAFAENHAVIVNDVATDERWYGSFDEKAEFQTQSLLAVPLNARGRTIGVLEVINHRAGYPFTAEDVDLLQSFGAQAAIAIENARLFTTTDQALQARVEELTTLQQIDRQLNASLDFDEVMSLTLDWAIRVTGAERGLLAIVREEEDGARGLQFLASHGYDEETVARYTEEELWPLTRGALGKSVQVGEPTLMLETPDNEEFITVAAGMCSQLSVPVRRENRVIGVIALESPDVRCFSEDELELVTRLADHAAVAIDNARLFQQVQQANEAKTDFIDFVSHELKQPMTSMKGYTDLLRKGLGGPLNDQQMQFLQVIRTNVQRMDRLVSDLLQMSRIEAGRIQLEKSFVDPALVVEEVTQSFRQAIEEQQQHLAVKVSKRLPTVWADRGRLIQVLSNLISNAHKYTPEGGHITVSVDSFSREGQTYVRWRVADDGIGMSSEQLEQLFTKFFRADNPEVQNVKGTGLGLVITRSLVEMHDGEVSVESEVGKGSTFSFIIPVEEPARPDAGEAES